jgi:hypothetical protein
MIRLAGGPLLAAIIGGLIVHFATRRRDAENERRRQRIDYLVRAYRTFTHSARRELAGDKAEAFEDALSDVVLFGNEGQIKLAREVMKALEKGGTAPIDQLLISLRSDLRHELDLSHDGLNNVPTVRFITKNDVHTPLQVDESWEVKVNQTQASVAAAVSSSAHRPSAVDFGGDIDRVRNMAKATPGAAVVTAYGLVIAALKTLLGESNQDSRDAPELARVAINRGLVTKQFVDTVHGLVVLKDLSRHESANTGLSVEKAIDYIDLVAATLYIIHTAQPGAVEPGTLPGTG